MTTYRRRLVSRLFSPRGITIRILRMSISN